MSRFADGVVPTLPEAVGWVGMESGWADIRVEG